MNPMHIVFLVVVVIAAVWMYHAVTHGGRATA